MATYLVTGANRGIGLEFVRQLLARGDSVVAACRKPEAADGLKALACDRLSVLALDVTDGASLAAAKAALGDRPLDGLINNAGIAGAKPLTVLDADPADLAHVLEVNTIAPLRIVQAFIDNLRKGKAARIMTLSSRMGSTSHATADRIAYRASKTAVNKIMQGLATELAPEGIAVVSVHPGWVRTDMGGSGADITQDVSVAGLLKVLDNLKVTPGGQFLNYDGSVIPW